MATRTTTQRMKTKEVSTRALLLIERPDKQKTLVHREKELQTNMKIGKRCLTLNWSISLTLNWHKRKSSNQERFSGWPKQKEFRSSCQWLEMIKLLLKRGSIQLNCRIKIKLGLLQSRQKELKWQRSTFSHASQFQLKVWPLPKWGRHLFIENSSELNFNHKWLRKHKSD